MVFTLLIFLTLTIIPGSSKVIDCSAATNSSLDFLTNIGRKHVSVIGTKNLNLMRSEIWKCSLYWRFNWDHKVNLTMPIDSLLVVVSDDELNHNNSVFEIYLNSTTRTRVKTSVIAVFSKKSTYQEFVSSKLIPSIKAINKNMMFFLLFTNESEASILKDVKKYF